MGGTGREGRRYRVGGEGEGQGGEGGADRKLEGGGRG